MDASCATRRSERIGLLSAAHAEPDNMRAPTAQIEPPTQRAESAIGVPASAEIPRPCLHSVADHPALGWL
jgi:hypothetical protein